MGKNQYVKNSLSNKLQSKNHYLKRFVACGKNISIKNKIIDPFIKKIQEHFSYMNPLSTCLQYENYIKPI